MNIGTNTRCSPPSWLVFDSHSGKTSKLWLETNLGGCIKSRDVCSPAFNSSQSPTSSTLRDPWIFLLTLRLDPLIKSSVYSTPISTHNFRLEIGAATSSQRNHGSLWIMDDVEAETRRARMCLVSSAVFFGSSLFLDACLLSYGSGDSTCEQMCNSHIYTSCSTQKPRCLSSSLESQCSARCVWQLSQPSHCHIILWRLVQRSVWTI